MNESSSRLAAMHDQIECIHKNAVDQVNADVLHLFIDEQQQEIDWLRSSIRLLLSIKEFEEDGAIAIPSGLHTENQFYDWVSHLPKSKQLFDDPK